MTNQRRMTDIFRESNLAWIRHCLDQQKSLILRLNRGRKILEGGTRLAPNVFCIRFTCKGLHLSVSLGSSSLRGRQLREPKGPNCIFVIVARHLCFILHLHGNHTDQNSTKISVCKLPNEKLFQLLGSSLYIFIPPCKQPLCVWTLARK